MPRCLDYGGDSGGGGDGGGRGGGIRRRRGRIRVGGYECSGEGDIVVRSE